MYKFKKLKKKTIKSFYANFVSELKESNPAKWYSMAKRLGTDQNNKDPRLSVECLKGMGDQEAADQVAQHFSTISNKYEPLDTSKLPAYLPAQEVLQVDEALPCELAILMTNIINSCLSQHHYPRPWKHEWAVPAEK